MSHWYDEVFDERIRFGVKADKVLFQGQSEFQKVVILETKELGRVLLIDDLFMTSERDEHFYHEMLVHPAMTTAKSIKRVLIIGGGDGGTAREVLSYPGVEQVVMVEIDEVVVEASRQFLSSIGTAWDDPRLDLIIGDGIDFVKTNQESFDVIILDHSDPVGPAEGLFSSVFHEGVNRLLAPGGVYTLQSESPFLQQRAFYETIGTLGGIFKQTRPYFGGVPIYISGMWSWTWASNNADHLAIDKERAAIQESRCKHYNGDIHKGAFAVPNRFRTIIKDGKINLEK